MNRIAIRKGLALGALVSMAAGSAQAAVLSPFTATYQASYGFINLGVAEFQLSRDDGCWRWQGVAEPVNLAALLIGTITDDSRFCVAAGNSLQPQRFAHREQGNTEDTYRLDFDWDNATVEYNSNEAFAVPQGAVDPFLLQIAARRWLESADDPANLPARVFVIVDEDEIKRYRLAVSEGASVKTDAGTFKTLRVARVDDSDKQLVFWVAPKLDFLPVKVEHRKNGKTQIELLLKDYEQAPQEGTI